MYMPTALKTSLIGSNKANEKGTMPLSPGTDILNNGLRLASCCLGALIAVGCSSSTTSQGVAGRAFVEDDQGNLVSVDQDQNHGTSAGPILPGESVDDKDWLKEFELVERSGRTIGSRDLKGQPYVLSFFFTTCPTICKRQNEKVQLLQKLFKGQPIRLVSITCDPDVDNPEVLSIYADQFGADPQQWLFLTGKLDYIRRVGTEIFFLPVDRRFHADKFLLVDADGNIFRTYEWPEEKAWESLLVDIRQMLDAGGRLPAS